MSSARRKTVPVGVGITDAYYRYQMEAVECEHRGRRNKTVVKNMLHIAKDLNRSPEEIIKFLGHALSSSGSYSSKSREYLINGTHFQQSVQNKVQEYCELFVRCGLCSNPETEYKVRGDTIFLECAACGGRSQMDSSLKLCKHILARHKLSKQSTSKKNGRLKRGKNGRVDASSGSKGTASLILDNSAENVIADTKRKRKQRVAQVDVSIPSRNDYDEHFENPFFSTRGNPLYVGCFDRINTASHMDESTAVASAVDMVQKFMTKNPTATTKDIFDAVTSAQESVKVLFSRDRLRIFVNAIYGTKGALVTHVDVLSLLTDSDRSLEHYLISVLEEVCASHDPKMFPLALMLLYEADVVSEECILDWWSESQSDDRLVPKETHTVFRRLAEPLVDWLEKDFCEEDE